MGLSTAAVDPRQRSHSRVRVSQDSLPYVTVSDSRIPQPGGPGLRIYIPQEQGGPVIPPDTASNSYLIACICVSAEACIPSCCLAIDVFSGSAIPAFSGHVTIGNSELVIVNIS
jgi:hypothetical protein